MRASWGKIVSLGIQYCPLFEISWFLFLAPFASWDMFGHCQLWPCRPNASQSMLIRYMYIVQRRGRRRWEGGERKREEWRGREGVREGKHRSSFFHYSLTQIEILQYAIHIAMLWHTCTYNTVTKHFLNQYQMLGLHDTYRKFIVPGQAIFFPMRDIS